jgi:hypothetical protein
VVLSDVFVPADRHPQLVEGWYSCSILEVYFCNEHIPSKGKVRREVTLLKRRSMRFKNTLVEIKPAPTEWFRSPLGSN